MKRADWSRARWIWGLLFVFATPLCAAPTSGEPSDAAPLVDSDTTLVSELSPTRADSLQALSDLTLRVEPRPLSSTQLQEARKAAQLAARNLDAFLRGVPSRIARRGVLSCAGTTYNGNCRTSRPNPMRRRWPTC